MIFKVINCVAGLNTSTKFLTCELYGNFPSDMPKAWSGYVPMLGRVSKLSLLAVEDQQMQRSLS